MGVGSEPPAQGFEGADCGGFQRFVVGKAGRARRFRSAVRHEVEARGHRPPRALRA